MCGGKSPIQRFVVKLFLFSSFLTKENIFPTQNKYRYENRIPMFRNFFVYPFAVMHPLSYRKYTFLKIRILLLFFFLGRTLPGKYQKRKQDVTIIMKKNTYRRKFLFFRHCCVFITQYTKTPIGNMTFIF